MYSYVCTVTDNDLTANANVAKELFVDALVSDGILTKEHGDEIKSTYALVTHRKGMFGQWVDRLFGKTDDKPGLVVMKVSAVK